MSLIRNKKVNIEYDIKETFEAGMELRGFEVKSLSNKLGNLSGARVIVRGGEAFIVGMYIPPYQAENTPSSYDPYRTRRLLLNTKEIMYLYTELEGTNLHIVPVSVYNKKKIKLEIALGVRRKKADKREYLKEKEDKKQAKII